MFYIIYCNLLLDAPESMNETIYLSYCEMKFIKYILRNVYGIINETNKDVFNKYINIFNLINNIINL